MGCCCNSHPDDREYDEPEPEYLNLGAGELSLVLRLAALEVPLGLAGLGHSVPPPQPGHDAAWENVRLYWLLDAFDASILPYLLCSSQSRSLETKEE